MSERWPRVRLGEVLRPVARCEAVDPIGEYPLAGVRLNGRGPFLRETVLGSQSAASRLFRVAEGDFIYSRLFAWRGAFGVIESDLDGCYVSGEFPTFRAVDHKLDVQFLQYWFRLSETLARVNDNCSGSTPLTRNRFKETFFLALEIPLPPLPEQRRIVTRIEEVAARVREALNLRQRSSANAAALLSSAARSVFFNRSWAHVQLGELVGRPSLRNGLSVKPFPNGSGVRCLRLSALRNGRIDCSETKPVPLTVEEAEPYIVRSGDVLVVRGNGSKDLVGRAGLIEGDVEQTIFPDLFIRVPLDGSTILPRFFVAWWNSPEMREMIEEAAKTTSGIWKINQGHMASFPIPITDVSTQQRVIAYLADWQAKIDSLSRLQAETTTELDALLPAVLDRAFKGEL